MKRYIVGLFWVCASAQAQEFKPKDYSPTGDAVIRTVGIKQVSRSVRSVVVSIGNRISKPRGISFACSLYGADGQPLGETSNIAAAVPPGSEVVAEAPTQDSAASAACRITTVYDD